MYKKLLIALALLSSKYTVHAEVHISYQSCPSDEIVITAGGYAMTAKQVQERGLEPVKVIMTNTGTIEQEVTMVSMSANEVYKHLKHSYLKPAAYVLLRGWFVAQLVNSLVLIMTDGGLDSIKKVVAKSNDIVDVFAGMGDLACSCKPVKVSALQEHYAAQKIIVQPGQAIHTIAFFPSGSLLPTTVETNTENV